MAELSLFFTAFLAGSVLPVSSEAVVLLLVSKGYNPHSLVLIATIGNSLGGITAYWFGWLGDLKKINRFLKIKESQLNRYEIKVKKYGIWISFFSFLPFVGDILLVSLGLVKAPICIVVFLMSLGKLLRYCILVYFYPDLEGFTRSIFDFLT